MTRIAKQTERRHRDEGDILLDFTITFDIEGEEYPAEPYSWGGSRGRECSLEAEIVNVRLGQLDMSRAEALLAFGRAWVVALEEAEAERCMEEYGVGVAA